MFRIHSRRFAVLAALLSASAANAVFAQQNQTGPSDQKPVTLQVGDAAPAVIASTDEGKIWNSKDQYGKKIVVIYFYPADFTGGCTAQACAYRDALKDIERKDVEVIGVSGDSVENHRLFKKEHGLNFTLLADIDGRIGKSFGVDVRDGGEVVRPIDGEEMTLVRGATIMRWTFVVGPDKKILHKDAQVNAGKDPENVLKAIERIPPMPQPAEGA